MGLPPAERQALARIESHLRRTDPKLAIMLEIFGRQPYQRKGPVTERVSPWRPSSRPLRVLALLVLLGVLCLLVIVLLTRAAQSAGARSCSPAASRLIECGPRPPGSPGHAARTGR